MKVLSVVNDVSLLLASKAQLLPGPKSTFHAIGQGDVRAGARCTRQSVVWQGDMRWNRGGPPSSGQHPNAYSHAVDLTLGVCVYRWRVVRVVARPVETARQETRGCDPR